MRRFDELHARMNDQHRRGGQDEERRGLIILLTLKLRIESSGVYAITIGVWVDSVHERYITMTMFSVR